MKLRLLISIISLSIMQSLAAQDSLKISYPLVMSFHSQCCGVPTETSLQSFMTSFKKKYKIKKITATHIGPMGREGEYYLAFKLTELSKKQKKDFITKIKKIKKLPRDKGTFSFMEKMDIDSGSLPGRATSKPVDF